MIARLALALSIVAPPDHWFGSDKLKHFFMSAFTQSVTYSALQAARVRHDRALAGAWGVTAVISVGKEVHDRHTTGLFSVRDLVWDAAGATAATVIIHNAVRTGAEANGSAPVVSARAPVVVSLLSKAAPGPIFRASPWAHQRRAGEAR